MKTKCLLLLRSLALPAPLSTKWILLLLPLFLLVISGCIPVTAEEATPVPTPEPQTVPVIALAPPSARPGTTVFLSSAGWQPEEILTLSVVSLQDSEPLTTTIFTDAADEQGRFTASFLLPLDLDQSDDPVVRVALTSNTTGVRAEAPFLLAIATGLPTPQTTSTTAATPPATPTTAATQPPTATPLPGATATPRPANFAIVATGGLNFRTGPSVAFPVIRALPGGTGVTVLGRNAGGDWLYVRLNNGEEGWLAARFTDFTGSVPVVATPALPPTPVAPTATATTPATTATPVITEWRGEYYNNDSLLFPPLFVRNDSTIDFNWGTGSPRSDIPNNDFSVRWTRSLSFDEGNYRFTATVDDGVRVWIDGDLIIDQWRDTSLTTYTAERRVSGGTHTLRVEYYDSQNVAAIRFYWERIDGGGSNFPDWRGEYWSNRNFEGSPTVVRNDEEIDFNWGSGSPDSRIPRDNFSARWTRRVAFDEGLYRFFARADDGIRVYLDNELIIDEWRDGEADVEYAIARQLDDDDYRIRVEYYERNGGALVEFGWRRVNPTATPTPQPTQTPTTAPTATAQPTQTPTAVPPTETPTATATPVATATATVTATATTAPPTETPMPTATATATTTATATATPVPVATASPATGSAGTQVTVSGSGFPANTTVNVHLAALAAAAAAEAATPTAYATTTTDENGAYRVTFTVPANWPNGDPIPNGRLVVVVATEGFTAQASAFFAYRRTATTPTPTVTPTATSAAPTETPVATTTATATTTVSPTPTTAVSPTPAANVRLTPATGGPNTQVVITGSGFPANSSVYVYLGAFDGAIDPNDNPEHYVILPTDAAGEYSGVLAIPATWPNGDAIPAGPLIVLVATNDFSVQASATFTYTGATP